MHAIPTSEAMLRDERRLKSYGFPGARPSPLQESTLMNMHRVLRESYLFKR